MNERIIQGETISEFGNHLIREEKSKNTIEKYMRDVRAFAALPPERILRGMKVKM